MAHHDASTAWQHPVEITDSTRLRRRTLNVVLFLTVLSSPIAFIEPSPYEGMMALLLLASFIAGVTFDRKILPLVVLLLIWNAGLLLALMPVIDDQKAVIYSMVSIYLTVNAIIFACIVTTHCEERLAVIRTAYVLAAFIASVLGIIGYFQIAPPDVLLSAGRARSTFKDPNVFGPYLVLPILFLIQSIILRGLRLTSLLALGVILVALFLSFSRGAWGHSVLSAATMVALMFITTPSARFRARITVLTGAAGAAVAMLLGILLSLPAVTTMFEERATLVQSYDTGSSGRFTTQFRAWGQIFDYPNGMGPLQYARHFGLDPHNDYLNAFYANGWIGGVTYPTLVLVTLFVGFRALLVRTPWQPYLVAVYAAYFGTVSEGFIVGTEHWRHYYLLLGLVWGLSAATENARRAAIAGREFAALPR
ncbi:MAG: O-antigen ligase domain-containing protein [Rhizobiales bacterium]|nr:O-antigen ligase domain-containing protein [Hyphomicrobiales bacterium]